MGRKQSDWVCAQECSLDRDSHTPHSKHWTCRPPKVRNCRDRGRYCRGQRMSALHNSAPLTLTLNIYSSPSFRHAERRRRHCR